MCGICGIASTRGTVDPGRLAAMSATLVQRGPDSDGAYLDGRVGLAARRLAIIDLATGDQPISNEDGRITVVQNGELYNYRELRLELERAGHRFSTSGDTEVLVHLYEEHGERFAERLRGMFAVALWDSERGRLVLARDPYGIKPLYYREAGGEIEFASELRALPRGEIDLDALDAFLAFNSVPGPLTIFREVRKLQAGHVLTWENGRSEIARYATTGSGLRRTRFATTTRPSSSRSCARGCATRCGRISCPTFRSACSCPAGSTRPCSPRSPPRRPRSRCGRSRSGSRSAASTSWPTRGSSPSATGRSTASSSSGPTRRCSCRLSPRRSTSRSPTPRRCPTYLVAQLAAEDVKVALSGEGGDELFGGYYTYAADLLAERAGWTAPLLRPLVERLPSSSARASFDYKAKRFVRAAHLPPLERHHGWKEIFSPDARAELTGRRTGFDPVDLLRARFAETEGAGLLARLQDVDLGTYLVDDLLVKTDRASMAHSLEARVPFLDPAVTNFSLGLADRHKVRGLRKKILLRKAAAPLIPSELLGRRKRGFSIPAAAWLRGDLEPFARETLSAETLRRQGFFRPEAVTRLIDDHVAGREDLSRQLWGLLAFTLWHERHVERTPGALREPRLEALA